jgi:hypothetical protein
VAGDGKQRGGWRRAEQRLSRMEGGEIGVADSPTRRRCRDKAATRVEWRSPVATETGGDHRNGGWERVWVSGALVER